MPPHSPAGIVASLSRSPRRNLVAAICVGAIGGALEYIVHTTVLEVHLSPRVSALVDSATVAAFSSMLVYILLREWRRRRALALDQMRVVAELNHHVRNALQRLAYTQYLPPQEQTQAVLESVDRIDKTLRDTFTAIAQQQNGIPEHLRTRVWLLQDRRELS